VRALTVPHQSPVSLRQSGTAYGPRPLRHTLDRIAILNNSGHAPGERAHLTALMADQWRANGIEVIELSGTRTFVEADLLFLNLSRPVIPEEYRRFAAQYPVTFNAGASDLRKHHYADGLLRAGASYRGPVIVRADQGYAAPVPRASASPLTFIRRFSGQPRPTPRHEPAGSVLENYRIYPSINDVPADRFGPDYIVQKFLPEENAGRYVLRQYYFLGDESFLSLQTSGAAIIRAASPFSLEEWTPPEGLLNLRKRLGLDYGRIDFVEVEGQPFVISVSRSPALPDSKDAGYVPPAYLRLAEALADALVTVYSTSEKSVF